MPGSQARSQKGKVTSKLTPRGAMAARTPMQRSSKDRPGATAGIGAQERQMLIARAAYFRAEKRGFAPGCELEDWIEAEAEVLRLIGPG